MPTTELLNGSTLGFSMYKVKFSRKKKIMNHIFTDSVLHLILKIGFQYLVSTSALLLVTTVAQKVEQVAQ